MEISGSFHGVFGKKTFAHLSTTLPEWVATRHTDVGRLRRRRRRAVGQHRTGPTERTKRPADDGRGNELDPYRFISAPGTVSEITTDGVIEHSNELAQRYMDQEEYPQLEEEESKRVILRIEPGTVRTS